MIIDHGGETKDANSGNDDYMTVMTNDIIVDTLF